MSNRRRHNSLVALLALKLGEGVIFVMLQGQGVVSVVPVASRMEQGSCRSGDSSYWMVVDIVETMLGLSSQDQSNSSL